MISDFSEYFQLISNGQYYKMNSTMGDVRKELIEDGPDSSVLNNRSSPVTLNELTMKARENIFEFQKKKQ